MDIGIPLRELGTINAKSLSEIILNLDEEAWYQDQSRQESYYVHHKTESIVIIALDDNNWPFGPISRGSGWNQLIDAALPVMQHIILNHYPPGGEIIRAVAAKLLPGSNIKAHNDVHQSFHCAHRIHVPITTNPKVHFTINGRPFQFKVGEAYEVNNQKQHSVVNKGEEGRITFIFDYMPPGPLAVDSSKTRPETLSTPHEEYCFRIPPPNESK